MNQIGCVCGHLNASHARAKGSEGRPGKLGACAPDCAKACKRFRRAGPSGYHDNRRR